MRRIHTTILGVAVAAAAVLVGVSATSADPAPRADVTGVQTPQDVPQAASGDPAAAVVDALAYALGVDDLADTCATGGAACAIVDASDVDGVLVVTVTGSGDVDTVVELVDVLVPGDVLDPFDGVEVTVAPIHG